MGQPKKRSYGEDSGDDERGNRIKRFKARPSDKIFLSSAISGTTGDVIQTVEVDQPAGEHSLQTFSRHDWGDWIQEAELQSCISPMQTMEDGPDPFSALELVHNLTEPESVVDHDHFQLLLECHGVLKSFREETDERRLRRRLISSSWPMELGVHGTPAILHENKIVMKESELRESSQSLLDLKSLILETAGLPLDNCGSVNADMATEGALSLSAKCQQVVRQHWKEVDCDSVDIDEAMQAEEDAYVAQVGDKAAMVAWNLIGELARAKAGLIGSHMQQPFAFESVVKELCQDLPIVKQSVRKEAARKLSAFFREK